MKPHELLEDIIIFSIVIPVIAGLLNYRRLHKEWKAFLLFLIIASIYTFISYFRYSPWVTNVLYSIYGLIEISFFAFIFLSFSKVNKEAYWLKCIIIGYSLVTMVEYSLQGINTYRQSSTEIIFWTFDIILGIFAANKILETDTNNRHKWLKLLIVIPTVVCSCFHVCFYIMLLILYTPKNGTFFSQLLDYINICYLFAYLPYTISFICLPKKKIFL